MYLYSNKVIQLKALQWVGSPLLTETKFLNSVFKILQDIAHPSSVASLWPLNPHSHRRTILAHHFVKFHWNIATPIPLHIATETVRPAKSKIFTAFPLKDYNLLPLLYSPEIFNSLYLNKPTTPFLFPILWAFVHAVLPKSKCAFILSQPILLCQIRDTSCVPTQYTLVRTSSILFTALQQIHL